MPNINTQLKKLFGNLDGITVKQIEEFEKKMFDTYRLTLKDVNNLLGTMYRKYGDDVSYATMNKYGRINKLFDDLAIQLKPLLKSNISIITNSVESSYAENFYYTGFAMESTLQMPLAFRQLRPETLKAIRVSPYDAFDWTDSMKGHYNTLYKQWQGTLTEGLTQGYGYKRTASLMKERMEVNFNNALRIVQTESHRAQTQGRIAAFEQSENAAADVGIEVARVWDATMDSKTRMRHIELDGKAADEDGTWDGVPGPGLFGVASEDINCRCQIVMEVLDYPPEVKKDNESKNLVPYKDYEKWKEVRIKELKGGKG